MKSLRPLLLISLAALFATACAGARRKNAADDASKKAAADKAGSEADTAAPDVNVEEASLRGKDFQSVDALEAIHFDYDSASLKEEQTSTLKNNAEYLKSHPSIEILVAGFCDDRGTTEYNLALGQKRAKEVRDYYIRLGINGKSVATISYGKESPSCSEPNEQCWSQNRRAETRVRVNVANAKKGEKPQ